MGNLAAHNPEISVVIPAYNAENYIEECLESVFSQSNCPVFEVIVVDDGSTDATGSLIEKNFRGVRLIRKPNGGPGSARNLGVEKAKSDVILFTDADDMMLAGRIEFQGRFMIDNPDVGLSFGNQHYSNLPDRNSNRDNGICHKEEFVIIPDIYARLLVEGNFIASSTCAVRRQAYIDTGGQPTGVFVGEDYAMHLRISHHWPVYATDRFLTWYRQGHGSNLMASAHTYRGPVVVTYNELLEHGARLTQADLSQALRRWRGQANALLRYTWAYHGRTTMLKEMNAISQLLPKKLRLKWMIISILPSFVGRAVRTLKQFITTGFS